MLQFPPHRQAVTVGGYFKIRLSGQLTWDKFDYHNILRKNETTVKHNGDIDALRGLSILTVILLHLNIRVPFSNTYLGSLMPKPVYNIFFWSGYYGVCIFFVISGFLICSSVLKKWNLLQKINLKAFYLMRFARIMPLLLALIFLLSLLHLTGISEFIINPKQVTLLRTILATLTFHINYLEIEIGYLPASWDILWSLSIEEFFYFFFPIICIIFKKEWKIIAFFSIFLVISPIARTTFYVNNEMGDRNYFAYLDAISLGCISAIIATRIKISKVRLNTLAIMGWICFILVFIFRKWTSQLGLTKIGLNVTILAIGISLILIWVQNRFQRERNPIKFTYFLRLLGRDSYEIYLTHMFIVIAFIKLYEYFNLSGVYIWLLYISVIIVSTMLGRLIANYFTTPINVYIRGRF